MTKAKSTHIWLKLHRGLAGKPAHQIAVLKGLGLKRVRQEVVLKDTAQIRGMVEKVQHLVEVEVRAGEAVLTGARARARANA